MNKNIPDIGQAAPDFEIPASDGTVFKLSKALSSGRNVKLLFFRGHW